MSARTTSTVRDTIERDLADEPQSVVKVYETGKLRTDLLEYVLTDQLAREFGKVLERVIEGAHPAGGETDKIGIWVSGFFGSGKSYFAKIVGHLLADTPVDGDSARGLFQKLLHHGRPADERLRELVHQAAAYRLACHLVTFDITALHSAAADRNVGLTFLRSFYRSLDLSDVIAFAERELEVQATGQYDRFRQLYEEKSGVPWDEDKHLTSASALFAACLAEMLPTRYATAELAHQSLKLAMDDVDRHLTIGGVIDRLVRWLDGRQSAAGTAPQRLVFVADEVGAWAGRDLYRIEQLRSFVDALAAKRIGEELRWSELREEISGLYVKQLQSLFNGRLTAGKSNTVFDYGVSLGDTSVKNEAAPVKLRAALAGTAAAQRAAEESASDLDAPIVYWVLEPAARLEERLRRAKAIERLKQDEEYRRIATQRTEIEADKLDMEAARLRGDAETDVARALQGGTIYWGGNAVTLEPPTNGGRGARGSLPASARTKVEEALRDRIFAKYFRFAEGDRVFTPANVEKLFSVPAGERAALAPDLALFDAEGHVHGNNVLVEEVIGYLKSSAKTAGQDVADAFAAVPFGWPADLIRFVAAALFVDGKVSAVDRAGKRYDDPKVPAARALFGTAAFKTTRLEIEEESLTPAESSQARVLLTELCQAPADGSEVALKEATLLLCTGLSKRVTVLEKAREVALPLPTAYDGVSPTIDLVVGAGSRVKIVRALLKHARELRDAVGVIERLEEFHRHHGFEQYRRSQQLLEAALKAGLADDATWGGRVQVARDEIQAIKDQRRVLDEWDRSYRKYRLEVLDAFRAAYKPLRAELHERTTKAAQAVTQMPEFQVLSLGNRAQVRTQFLGEGKPLHEVPLPELQNEQQLLGANADYSVAHMRSALAALDTQIVQAMALVIELYAEEQRHKGAGGRQVVTWKPAVAFTGKRFTTEAEIDTAFDTEKERLKKLVRDGKTVQAV